MVYTRHQSTGEFELQYINHLNELDSITWSNTVKPLQEWNKIYKVSDLQDISTSSPVVTSNWSDIQSYYANGQGYIDKVATNVNINMDQSDLREFDDSYVNIRLIFNQDDYKLTMHIFDSMQFKSLP